MGDARFPSIKYACELRDETNKLLDDTDLRAKKGGTPESETDWVTLRKPMENSDYEVVLYIEMNADEDYADESNYQLYSGLPTENEPVYECQRIDYARNKWFELLDDYISIDVEEHRLE